MDSQIKIISIDRISERQPSSTKSFGTEAAKRAAAFHQSLPGYVKTPLVNLKELAGALGVASIYVKDESHRFGLNAFKGLGGSYCIASCIAERLGISDDEFSYDQLRGDDVKRKLGHLTFVTATDGNHGRGVAWAANQFGFNSVVYMPKGSAEERLRNIKALGAEASITELNYDDTVRYASKCAEKNGWILVQDTAWEGYEDIPARIMRGYTTMAAEITEQLQTEKPTHIFLQAGVGAMAGALTAFFADFYTQANRPMITIVEPDKADCIYRTAHANDGTLHTVKGDMNTIMAGLSCGEPCTIGWDILRDYADHFISIPDYVAAKGMRILGNPLGDDPRIVSGESGAATLGVVAEIMQKDQYTGLREKLKINKSSKILCISTEGDTDRDNYRRIVWDGEYQS